MDGAEGQTVKRHYKPRYEACSAVDGASAKLLADGVLLHRKMDTVNAEFHVELPFEVRVRLNYTWIRLVRVGVYPPVSVDCVPLISQPMRKYPHLVCMAGRMNLLPFHSSSSRV